MELIPKQFGEELTETTYEKYEGMELMLSELANTTRKFNRLPSTRETKQRFLQAMQESFEMIGGVPRLMLWADQNYEEFVKIIGKTIPSVLQQVNVQNNFPTKIVSAIPPGPLDGEWSEGEFTEVPK